jgi:hypothetical protein
LHYVLEESDMNTKKEMSIAVMFLAAAIIFVSSTPLANNAFAQSQDGEDESGSKYYENFLNCLSDASGDNSYPAGDQIVNCFAESGYIQGSSSTSSTDDSEEDIGNVDVSVVGDESDGSDEEETENVDVSVVGDGSDEEEEEDDSDEEEDDSDEEEDDSDEGLDYE